jgi:hypothetical protein
MESTAQTTELRELLGRTEGMITLAEGTLLYELAKAVEEGCIVEVGSYRGRSTVALARGSLDGHEVPVYAIEPHELFTGVLGGQFGPQDRAAFFRAMLDSGCAEVVRLINLSSEQVAPTWRMPVSLLWIDGDHRYEGVRRDFDCWLPHVTPTGTIVFDDSRDPQLGPLRLIEKLVDGGGFAVTKVVGKVTALQRRGA